MLLAANFSASAGNKKRACMHTLFSCMCYANELFLIALLLLLLQLLLLLLILLHSLKASHHAALLDGLLLVLGVVGLKLHGHFLKGVSAPSCLSFI